MLSHKLAVSDWSVEILDEEFRHRLQAPPFSATDHRPCGLALFPVPFEPATGRGIAARAASSLIRRWGRKFGPAYARQLRRKPPATRDVWHLDEVVISIAGRKHWLWRAVDQDGYVLEEIVQSRRDTKAARRLLVRLLKRQSMPPKRIITDSFAPMEQPSVT